MEKFIGIIIAIMILSYFYGVAGQERRVKSVAIKVIWLSVMSLVVLYYIVKAFSW
jgi:hypothetical protein